MEGTTLPRLHLLEVAYSCVHCFEMRRQKTVMEQLCTVDGFEKSHSNFMRSAETSSKYFRNHAIEDHLGVISL